MQFNKELTIKYFEKFYKEVLKIKFTPQHSTNILFLLEQIEEDENWQDYKQVAYFLATIAHETAFSFAPRDEKLASPGTELRKRQDRYADSGFYGRGYIQLTWKDNYAKMSRYVGVDLVKTPELAKRPTFAYLIAARGCQLGLFTGAKFSDYINSKQVNYVGCRACVNGKDKADVIAHYALCIERFLKITVITEPDIVNVLPVQEVISAPIDYVVDQDSADVTFINTNVDSKPASTSNQPTEIIPSVEPKETTGPKSWKTSLVAIGSSLGVSITSAYAWITDSIQNIQPYLPHIIIVTLVVAAVFAITYVIFRFWLVNKREARAHEINLQQMMVRADPSMNNVELQTENKRNKET